MITRAICENAAREIGCDVAVVMAVAVVESSGAGFDKDGRIVVRFEGHKFRDFTTGRYDSAHPDLSYQYSQIKKRKHGRAEFNRAFELDKKAAMMATSWGLFQIMGFNYAGCGFKSVDDFVAFNSESESNQITCMVRLMVKFGLRKALIAKDWYKIALVWNGQDAVKLNNYPAKLAAAYDNIVE